MGSQKASLYYLPAPVGEKMVTSSTATQNPRSMTQNFAVWGILEQVCVSPSTTAAANWSMVSSTTQTGWSNAKLIAG